MPDPSWPAVGGLDGNLTAMGVHVMGNVRNATLNSSLQIFSLQRHTPPWASGLWE